MILFFTGPSLSSGDDLARWQEANQEAHALLRKGEFEQAIKSWNMALDAVEPDNREVGEILYWVGEAHWRNTDLLGAENSFAQWVAWTREHGSDTELSRALSTLAAAQERAGNFEDAYRLRTENVEILEKRWPPGFILASAHWQLESLVK